MPIRYLLDSGDLDRLVADLPSAVPPAPAPRPVPADLPCPRTWALHRPASVPVPERGGHVQRLLGRHAGLLEDARDEADEAEDDADDA